MKKSKLNLVIDAVMFITLVAVAGIGLLLKYVLLPGFKRNQVYGKNVELEYLGMDRHEWGNVHFIISMILTFLLVVHIILHWKQVVHIFSCLLPVKSVRIFCAGSFVLVTAVLCLLPFFIDPTLVERNGLKAHVHCKQTIEQQQVLNQTKEHTSNAVDEHVKEHSLPIYGYMTLKQVSIKYGVPEKELAQHLGVPIEKNEMHLGYLRKHYDFTMSELRDFIRLKRKN